MADLEQPLPAAARDTATHQANKRLILDYYRALDDAAPAEIERVIARHTTDDYLWQAVHPFNEQRGAAAVAERFWRPLREAWRPLERRQDIFMAGASATGSGNWVVSMGHLVGLFERHWLGIPPTGRIGFLRYAEFNRLDEGRIAETLLHLDLIAVMNQAGLPPLPRATGAEFVIPGPATHDGLLFEPQPLAESAATLELVQRMARDLFANPDPDFPAETLAHTWHPGMMWYGPAGIGSTMGYEGFRRQHQNPFRAALNPRRFNGHRCRFTEGHYGAWTGWPSLTLTVSGGGFLGLPATGTQIDMRVVDIYRREGDRIAENWVFIDLPYTLHQQGLDIFDRLRELAPH